MTKRAGEKQIQNKDGAEILAAVGAEQPNRSAGEISDKTEERALAEAKKDRDFSVIYARLKKSVRKKSASIL
jgi:hypothetical protein